MPGGLQAVTLDCPDSSELRMFLAVAQAGSLSAAARRLPVSQSTLSRRISRLEQQLGVMLFEKTLAGYRLTAAGHKLMSAAESVAAAEARFVQLVDLIRRRDRPLIRIRSGEWATRAICLDLSHLESAAPGCELALLTQGYIDNDSIEANDIVIQQGPVDRADMVCRHIGKVAYAAFAGRSHRRRPPRVEDDPFQSGTWALWCRMVDRNGVVRLVRERGYPGLGPDARIISCTSVHSILALVQSGDALAFLPLDVGRQADLVQVSGLIQQLEHDYWLSFHAQVRRQKPFVALVRALAANLQRNLCAQGTALPRDA